jgi:murein DD-endopeptidase MepM/ murein hydrolase activator NlpD
MFRITSVRLVCCLATLAVATCSADFAEAQQVGRSRLLPNPVPSGGNRINVRDPQRGQGGGQFGDPRSGGRTHSGIDLTADAGTPVTSVDSGRVIRSEVSGPYCSTPASNSVPTGTETLRVEQRLNSAGNNVVVQHGDGTSAYYYHLNGQEQPAVGAYVLAGQPIGQVGRTGNVPERADTHLHLEVRNSQGIPVAPEITGSNETSNPPAVRPASNNGSGRIEYASPVVTPRQPGAAAATASFRLR